MNSVVFHIGTYYLALNHAIFRYGKMHCSKNLLFTCLNKKGGLHLSSAVFSIEISFVWTLKSTESNSGESSKDYKTNYKIILHHSNRNKYTVHTSELKS